MRRASGVEHFADKRDGHRVGTDALARDAADGWGALKRSCDSTIGSMGSSSVTLRETRLCEAG